MTWISSTYSYSNYMTSNPAISSLSRSSISNSTLSHHQALPHLRSSFVPSPPRRDTAQSHRPDPHAPSCKCRSRTPRDGSTYVTTSSWPTAMSRFAMTVMRESVVLWSRYRTETLGCSCDSCESEMGTIPRALRDLCFPIIIIYLPYAHALFACDDKGYALRLMRLRP